MGEDLFDDLARTLASPMPRRRALRLAGAALVAAAASGLRPRAASASPCGPDTLCSSQCQLAPHVGACGVETKNKCGQIGCRLEGCLSPGDICCREGNDIAWICPKNTRCAATRSASLNCIEECTYNSPVLGSQKRPYDSATQCCTRTGVQPKLMGFDPQACRETLTPRLGFRPTSNGCGTKEDKFPDTWPGPGAKIGKAKYTGKRANFGKACNQHDICYDTCGKPKDVCDKEFCKRLNQSCAQTWPGAKQADWRGRCESEANLYCAGVVLAGDAAYWKAQGEACQCCP